MSGSRPEEADPVFEEVRVVRDRVEELLGVVTFMAQDPGTLSRQEEALRTFFGRSRRRAEVFLALDRHRNLTDIGTQLGMKQQNVWREVKAMAERGLVVKVNRGTRAEAWIRAPVLEKVGLTQRVRLWFPVASEQVPVVSLEADADGTTDPPSGDSPEPEK